MGKISCAVRGCHTQTGEGISMFQFPKDPVRAQAWLQACNRQDLSGKSPTELQKNYKLCELHFEEKFKSKGGQSRTLFRMAEPTIFPFPGLKQQIKVLMNDPPLEIVMKSDASSSPQPGTSQGTEDWCKRTFLLDHPYCATKVEVKDEATPVPILSSSISTQTPQKLSFNTPRKQKLRLKIKALIAKYKRAEQRPRASKRKWSIKQFKDMCDYFLDKRLAALVKSKLKPANVNPVRRNLQR